MGVHVLALLQKKSFSMFLAIVTQRIHSADDLKSNLDVGGSYDTGSVHLEDLNNESHSHALTVTWSYLTS